ncbi:nuclear transport factor 2 family protein [Paenibacillus dendritiformis]|uniref:nuclear transport factor 2 family protein n=1 Tax=Paenibacillus dendritiformis TaxID=130049 RepID=UPI0018CDEC7A|nr:nuclear transport factor 2 family protein [Paenibacillus dendritiformis]
MDKMKSDYGNFRVSCPENCGNAPKKLLLKELHIAFTAGDIPFILEQMTDDMVWNVVGAQKMEGKDKLAAALIRLKSGKAIALQISSIITHGTSGSANGSITLDTGQGYAFCGVYHFNRAKQAKIKRSHFIYHSIMTGVWQKNWGYLCRSHLLFRLVPGYIE